jgi:hypothetical protein
MKSWNARSLFLYLTVSFHSSWRRHIRAHPNQFFFVLLKENFFAVVLLHNKTYEVQFQDLSNEVLEFFSEPQGGSYMICV